VTRFRIINPVSLAAVLAALVFSPGCKRGNEEAKMPPAKGPGAAPLPELPDLGSGDNAGATAGANKPNRTTGTLVPRATANVASKATGVITKIAVDEGEHVKKGALLFRIDASGAALQRDQAQAALKAAKVQLAAVKVEYDRAQRLHEQNALTQAAFDQASARYQGAQVAVEQAGVALSMARKMLSDTTVRAPISGTVTRRNLDVGDTVSTMPPTVVLQIQDQSVLELHFSLPESALGKLGKGTVVHAKFASEPEARELKVDRIDPVVDPALRTLTAVVLIDNPGGVLRPDMLAEVAVGDDTSDEDVDPPAPTEKAPQTPAAPKAPAPKAPVKGAGE